MKDNWKIRELSEVVDTVDVYLPYEEPPEDASWVVDLARMEEEIDQTGVISFDASTSPEKVLKEGTVLYLRFLRNYVTKLSSMFNSHKSVSSSAIKVYGIANTDADFMVFRNSLKLIFSAQRPGVIQISYNAHTGGFFTPSGGINPTPTTEQLGDVIHAQLGPFNEAVWTYQGRKVNAKEMVRYFLTRFIQSSAR